MTEKDNVINMASEARPKKFSDMVGQAFAQGVGKQLGKGIVSGQGYIICGPKGCGKTTLARIIAKSLNCSNRNKSTGDPCEECSSCRQFESGVNPMVREVNAASNRGINDIRDITSTMNISLGDTGSYKVYILDEVHMLTHEAFSALLKPMEEPPENVIFICTTTNKDKIPETILSRSPIIPILLMNSESIKKVLERTVDIAKENNSAWNEVTEKDIEYAVVSSDGSARQAITNLSSIVFHGVEQKGSLDLSKNIAKGFVDNSPVTVLTESRKALDNENIEPIVLIQTVVAKLVDHLMTGKAQKPAVLSYQIANLSQVASEITVSTQKSVIAAKIMSSMMVPAKAV